MKILVYLFRSSPVIVSLAIVMSFVSGLGNASLVALAHRGLTSGLADGQGLSDLGMRFALLTVFSLGISISSQLLLSHLYRQAIYDWTIHLSEEILGTPLRQLEKIGGANILSVLIKDISAIGGSLLPILPQCSNVVVVICCLGYLCWLAWQPFLGTLVIIALGVFSYRFFGGRSRETLKAAREDYTVLYGQFRLMTNGIKELKLHRDRRLAFLGQNLKPTAARIQKKLFFWNMFYLITQTWAKFLLLFVLGMLLFVFPSFVQFDSRVLSGYILTLLYIRGMLTSIMAALPPLAAANVAFSKIKSLGLKLNIGRRESEESKLAKLDPITSFRKLECRQITHSYYREREGSNFTLGPVSLSLEPGEIVFLVGGNGSGKTTLAKLIAGLYVPETGEIVVDGVPITEEKVEWYRQLFSVVFSDFQLFDKLLGLESPKLDEKVKEYLVKLQLDHKVKIKDGNLSTTALSGGQRQRLALLTAYLEDRPVYIFDEWASSQDPIFRDVFYTQFLPELRAKGKAILAITHDDKYFDQCDRIIKLDYGQLVES
ncbi:MAG: cyclic peptide export ABC transporter [Cyanobacteria bacterium J06614_10]